MWAVISSQVLPVGLLYKQNIYITRLETLYGKFMDDIGASSSSSLLNEVYKSGRSNNTCADDDILFFSSDLFP